MDPAATMKLIDECIARREHSAAAEHATNLQGWLASGGFAPDVTAGQLTMLLSCVRHCMDNTPA